MDYIIYILLVNSHAISFGGYQQGKGILFKLILNGNAPGVRELGMIMLTLQAIIPKHPGDLFAAHGLGVPALGGCIRSENNSRPVPVDICQAAAQNLGNLC